MIEILQDKNFLKNFILVLNSYIKGYNNIEKTTLEFKKLKGILKDEKIIFLISPFVYNNLKTISKYINIALDSLEINKNSNENEYISQIIYLLRNKLTDNEIEKYMIDNYNLKIDIKSLASIKNILSQVKDEDEKTYIRYINHINLINKNKIDKIDFSFFEKNEKIKWLATNNRKTPTYFPDYGTEIENLIKLIYEDEIIEYNYRKTLLSLKIMNFENNIENANILVIRAILTSILKRERYGSGAIPRYIENGTINKLLKRYKKLLEDEINGN